jgi:hypothetical protein
MQTITLHSRISSDGFLHLKVPDILSNTNCEVTVIPQSNLIDNELQAKLDAILASGDETEYVRHNPILREKVDNGLRAFERGEGFAVSPEQLGINLDD